MKKTLAFLLIILSATIQVSAQLRFGVDVGLSLSQVSFEKAIADSKLRQGFFVGPKLKASIPKIGLGADVALRYAQRSIHVVDDLSSDERETYENNNMSYLEVPLNIRWDIGIKSWGIYVATGPQWDLYIGKSDWSSPGQFKNELEHSIFSWNVGAGVWLFNHLNIGLTYNIPFTPQGTYSSVVYNTFRQVAENIKMKTYSWQISADFYF